MTPRLLSLTCGLLACLIAMEVHIASRADEEPDWPQAAPEHARAVPAPARVVPVAAPDRWVSVVLGRPLFAPDRRPVPGASSADAGLPRLSGVIIAAGSAAAIFQPSGDSKPVVAHAGDMVGGWQVTEISNERVGMRKANEVALLRPHFANLQGNAASTPGPVRTRWETAADGGLLAGRWSNPQLQP